MLFTNRFYNRAATAPAKRIEEARRMVGEAECILIGAGAGLSTAAGLSYAGADFEREFRPWIERYGITDLYSSSFHTFATEEERWAYWARHIWFARYRPEALPLYRELLRMVEGRDYFVITTNTDGQFLKAGFEGQRLFYTQGDYAYLQDAEGEDKRLYYNEETVMQMLAHTSRDCRIPSAMVPHDPVNGHKMAVNLRCDDTFVEDEEWHRMCRRYEEFVGRTAGRRLVMLEFGVGFNTPGIIRFPFEQMAAQFPHAALIRFNAHDPQLIAARPRRYVCFAENLDTSLIHKLLSPDISTPENCSNIAQNSSE